MRVESFPRVSDAGVRRFVLAVILIAHRSCRQVVELLRDLFGVAPSIGTIHTWVGQAAQRAGAIKRVQGLSGRRVFIRSRRTERVGKTPGSRALA